jgi:hypothetical protein
MKDAPYLGCRLRLRTRAQVRYEGQLYIIDPTHLTLSLANVRALDSSASDPNVYEYITFRALDVLDMTVLPPPDFDFDAANAKLQRPQPQPSEPAYAPHSSFYDHFSEGKAAPRPDTETFGESKQRRGSHRGRRYLPRRTTTRD